MMEKVTIEFGTLGTRHCQHDPIRSKKIPPQRLLGKWLANYCGQALNSFFDLCRCQGAEWEANEALPLVLFNISIQWISEEITAICQCQASSFRASKNVSPRVLCW